MRTLMLLIALASHSCSWMICPSTIIAKAPVRQDSQDDKRSKHPDPEGAYVAFAEDGTTLLSMIGRRSSNGSMVSVIHGEFQVAEAAQKELSFRLKGAQKIIANTENKNTRGEIIEQRFVVVFMNADSSRIFKILKTKKQEYYSFSSRSLPAALEVEKFYMDH